MTEQTKILEKHNTLNHKKIYELYKWIKENYEDVKYLSFSSIAEAASKSLKFTVSRSNIKGAINQLGIKHKEADKDINTAISDIYNRFVSLEKRISEIEDKNMD